MDAEIQIEKFIPPNDRPVVTGKAVRFAPARDDQPRAFMWKFWAQGKEVYASSRMLRDMTRISVHASGQIHMHTGGRDLLLLAQPLVFGDGKWVHAFELRFLLSPDAHKPPPEKLKRGEAYFINVPDDAVLITNLLIGSGRADQLVIPPEFATPLPPLWKTTLTDGRTVFLIGRLHGMDDQNRAKLHELRHTINPRLNVETRPDKLPYMELRNVIAHPTGGNVILVVPMGDEAVRVLPSPAGADESTSTISVRVSTPTAKYSLTAPNGAVVGTLTFTGLDSQMTVDRGRSMVATVGAVSLRMHASELLFGQPFQRPSISCPCPPTIDGTEPRDFAYKATTSFDGEGLTVRISQNSSGLRKRAPGTMPALGSDEELLVAVPVDGLLLSVTRENLEVTVPLNAKLHLTPIVKEPSQEHSG